MKTILVWSLLFLSNTYCYCQIIFKDLNNDKRKDSIIKNTVDGSSFSSTSITIVDGKSRRRFTLTENYDYSSFLSIVPIPKEGKHFYNSFIEHELYGNKARSDLDPSLKWLLSCKDQSADISSQFFDKKIIYPPEWIKTELKISQNYHARIDKKLISGFLNSELPSLDEYNEVWVNYYSHNHKEINLADSLNENGLKAFRTNHGVIIKKGDCFSWIFISDSKVIDAHEKLRWPSIKKVILYDNYAFILQDNVSLNEKYIFLVNYDKGIVLRLNKDHLNLSNVDDFHIQNGLMIIKSINNASISVPLADLLTADSKRKRAE